MCTTGASAASSPPGESASSPIMQTLGPPSSTRRSAGRPRRERRPDPLIKLVVVEAVLGERQLQALRDRIALGIGGQDRSLTGLGAAGRCHGATSLSRYILTGYWLGETVFQPKNSVQPQPRPTGAGQGPAGPRDSSARRTSSVYSAAVCAAMLAQLNSAATR